MNEEFRKRRLLDALEYIDDEYIASAARYKMKIKPHSDEPPVQTVGGSLKKYWKQYLGLVACLLLLAFASPIFSFVAQNIGSLAGSFWGRQEEVPYLQFCPDLEPISNKKVEEVNRAFLCLYLNTTSEELEQKYGENYLEDLDHLRVIRNYDWTSPYYGTFGNCVVFSIISYQMGNPIVEIAGYTLNANTFVYSKKNMYRLEQAYLEGVLGDEDIALLAKRHEEFLKFKAENRDMFPQ